MIKNIIQSVKVAAPNVFQVILLTTTGVLFANLIFYAGYTRGYEGGILKASREFESFLSAMPEASSSTPDTPTVAVAEPIPTSTIAPSPTAAPALRPRSIPNWSGPELWEAVNTRRVTFGVNPLQSASELCTIASIRLNELLELGKLDGHEGFSTLSERRPDLVWIFEKYNVSEFLVAGASSAAEAVDLWVNTLGHSKLLTGGEYVWGCTYAQNSFGVAIAGY